MALSNIQPITVIQQSARAMRDAVMQGHLRPGQKLVEADLCEKMGISRASLREALRRLEAEGLIEMVPNRGPFVAQLGWKEVEDIHDVWAMLTGESVARFTAVATDAEIDELGTAHKQVSEALRNGDSLAQLAATNLFFHHILQCNDNKVLFDMVRSLVSRVNFLRAQALHQEGWGRMCDGEIGRIIECIRARRPQDAREATQRHIASATAAAKKALLEANLAGPPIKQRKARVAPVK